MQIVSTPVGDARYAVVASTSPSATLVLGHGAGGGIDARDLSALARQLPARGITVVRVEQPWRVAGRKVAGPPPTLDKAWLAVLDAVRAAPELGGQPLVAGGRSAGARVACRTATAVGAVGVLALAFPLHPPGRPERSRADELLGAGVPTLVIQGSRDSFGAPEEFPSGGTHKVVEIPEADHSLAVRKGASLTPAEITELVVRSAADWILALV